MGQVENWAVGGPADGISASRLWQRGFHRYQCEHGGLPIPPRGVDSAGRRGNHVELTNEGRVEHEWVILHSGVTISSESELPEIEEELLADYVYWEDEVEPGETKTVTFTAPPAGEYQVICAIEGHFDAGMEGTLISESSQACNDGSEQVREEGS